MIALKQAAAKPKSNTTPTLASSSQPLELNITLTNEAKNKQSGRKNELENLAGEKRAQDERCQLMSSLHTEESLAEIQQLRIRKDGPPLLVYNEQNSTKAPAVQEWSQIVSLLQGIASRMDQMIEGQFKRQRRA